MAAVNPVPSVGFTRTPQRLISGEGVFDNFWKLVRNAGKSRLSSRTHGDPRQMQRPIKCGHLYGKKPPFPGSAPCRWKLSPPLRKATGITLIERPTPEPKRPAWCRRTRRMACRKVGSNRHHLPPIRMWKDVKNTGEGGLSRLTWTRIGKICILEPGVFGGQILITEATKKHRPYYQDKIPAHKGIWAVSTRDKIPLDHGPCKDLIIRGGPQHATPPKIEEALPGSRSVAFAGGHRSTGCPQPEEVPAPVGRTGLPGASSPKPETCWSSAKSTCKSARGSPAHERQWRNCPKPPLANLQAYAAQKTHQTRGLVMNARGRGPACAVAFCHRTIKKRGAGRANRYENGASEAGLAQIAGTPLPSVWEAACLMQGPLTDRLQRIVYQSDVRCFSPIPFPTGQAHGTFSFRKRPIRRF